MKKKILALILSLLLCFSVPVSVTASAFTFSPSFSASRASGASSPLAKLASDLTENLAPYLRGLIFSGSRRSLQDTSAKLMAGMMTGIQTSENGNIDDTIKAVCDNAAPETSAAAADADYEIRVTDLSELLKKYIFIKIEDAPETARMIADSSVFTYHTIKDDSGTLYISVNIEDNPEIFNYAVFRQVVENLYARQNEELLTDKYGKTDYVLSYEHIAGELAMHMLVFAAVNEIMQVTRSRDKRLVELYRTCAIADLNIDEVRVPSFVITVFGKLVMSTIRFNFYKLLGLI